MPGLISLWCSVPTYTALTFVAALGALQVAALHNDLEGLAWPLGLRYGRWGYLLAGLLVVTGLLGGLFLAPLSTPLPALLMGAIVLTGGGLALLASAAGAAARLSWSRRHRQPPQRLGRPIELGPVEATFYQPVVGSAPFPALCLLPDPTAPDDDLTPLVQALVKSGIAVLSFDWRSLDNADRLTLQGIVAMGVSHLERWPETDGGRLGLVGVGLGGDLALRSAAMDPGVAAALAIEPVLSPRRPGLGLEALHTLSWFEAQRRAYCWRHSTLVGELGALAAIPCIVARPVAIVTGSPGDSDTVDNLDILRFDGGCALVAVAHKQAVERTVAWCTEHLA